MALWNFLHDTLHIHAYVLPSIALGIGMIVNGLISMKKQSERQEDMNAQLGGKSAAK